MKRHEAGLPEDAAPSRPLSRASRAESMGSLADFSAHATSQPPAELEHGYRHKQHMDNFRARGERRHVGGGGLLLHGKSHLSMNPPLRSSNNNYKQPQGWPYMVYSISCLPFKRNSSLHKKIVFPAGLSTEY